MRRIWFRNLIHPPSFYPSHATRSSGSGTVPSSFSPMACLSRYTLAFWSTIPPSSRTCSTRRAMQHKKWLRDVLCSVSRTVARSLESFSSSYTMAAAGAFARSQYNSATSRPSTYSPFFNRKIPIVFRTLRSLTFLAVKYEVQHVIAEATARLEVVFPVRFEDKRVEWNALDTVVEDSPIRGLKLGDAVTAVCLARAIDAEEPPAFIVMALYFCCQIQPDHLLENPAEDDNLSRADLSACLFGSLALARSNSHTKNSIFDFSGDGVCSSKACRSARWRTIRAWTSDHVFSGTTALDSIKHWGETEVTESGSLCDRCDEKLHSMYDARRRDAFNQLGEIFGVPGWPLPDN